jgi:hypothetical protein
MARNYDFVSGDTGSKLRVRCLNIDGTTIDLTGTTVAIAWIVRATDAEIVQAMTILNPILGTAEYQFQAGELTSPAMSFEIRITDILSNQISSLDLVDVQIREQLP